MIIIAVSPVPRLRNGRQSPRSIAADPIPPKTKASRAAKMRSIPRIELKKYATSAPNTICSDSAKFTRPVVPKISDSPMAHSPMIRPKMIPS